ncbi:winged helix-turn-helix transcriptional regulator [Candidatus Lucifugimonas marina]|uniref:Transcriptional regulator n=1 Tax=Candidatus Lucifugimonas marina TaxID=3038979 RepID=A0AAJ6CU41_9CHLR|nr:transcriptional regulator [SAR202 cluster bacterium JH702]MDG0869608.1 transcriptional regulator [SAR202 cluster bacterium JH639]WFG34341.1 transcriptional regulator [SAR202 cluster bacterium JH545]WFG38270.1 transcriptional regulator [SAR202 cluster bacterium JH1073]
MAQANEIHQHDSTNSNMCPHYEAAMELLAKRWTGLILTVLQEEPARFSKISTAVDGISDRMLSQRLGELEEIGMVERKVDSTQRPVLVEYASTQMACELAPVFDALQNWAEKWMPAQSNG